MRAPSRCPRLERCFLVQPYAAARTVLTLSQSACPLRRRQVEPRIPESPAPTAPQSEKNTQDVLRCSQSLSSHQCKNITRSWPHRHCFVKLSRAISTNSLDDADLCNCAFGTPQSLVSRRLNPCDLLKHTVSKSLRSDLSYAIRMFSVWCSKISPDPSRGHSKCRCLRRTLNPSD